MADEFEYDDRALAEEFDLGDNFGDLDVPPHRLAKVAKSINNVIKEAAPEAIRGVTSSLKYHLPNVRDTIDEGVNAVDDFKRLKDDISKELDPALNTLRQISLRVLPKAKRFIPKGIYNSLETKIKSGIKTETRELTDEERAAQANKYTVDDAMSRIFSNQASLSKEAVLDEKTQKVIDRHLESTRFKTTSKNLMVLGDGLQSVHGFLKTTFMEYLKKDIELKYNHLFIAKDTFNILKVMNANLDRKLEELKHNTAMPDSIKMGDPRFAKKSGTNGSVNDYMMNFRKQFFGNLREAIMSPLQMATQIGIPILDAMTSAGGGMSMSTLVGKGVGMAGRWYMGKKTDEFAQKNQSSFSILNRYTENLKDRLTMKAMNWANKNRDQGGPLGFLANLIPSLTPDLAVRNKLVNSASEPATFDNLTRQSIVEIIPTHLANIGKYVAGLAKYLAPNAKYEDITFNMAKRKLTDVKSAGTDLLASHGVDDTSIRLANEETLTTVKRTALFAKKQRYKSAVGKKTIAQIESISEELIKFFTNSGLMRRPLDIDEFKKCLTNPYHLDMSDYLRDVLDGIEDPMGFVSSLVATVTNDETGEIDPAAVAMLENGILAHTKKISLTGHLNNLTNTYGQSASLKELGLVDQYGQMDKAGVRNFYNRRNNTKVKYYKDDGSEYTEEELAKKGIHDYSEYYFQSQQNRDYTDILKAKKLLAELKRTAPDDPRVAMLESNDPVLMATALAMGSKDTILNKLVMGVGKAGKWAYDLGEKGVNKAKDFFKSQEDIWDDFMDSELGQDIKSGIGVSKEAFVVKSVHRLTGRKFQATASNGSTTERGTFSTDVFYKPGSFPDHNTIIKLLKKKNWKFDPEVQVMYSDSGIAEDELADNTEEKATTSFDTLNRMVTSNPLDVVPDYLQKILEAIYIVNGKKDLIPATGVTYRPATVSATAQVASSTSFVSEAAKPSAEEQVKETIEPLKARVPNPDQVTNKAGTLGKIFEGGIQEALTDLTGAAVESYDVVKDDLGRYTDKLMAYLPTKESFISHLPESCRERAGKIWDACAKVGGTFHEFCTHYKKEFVSIPKVAECIDKLEEYAAKIRDPEQRKQVVADTLARCQNIVETIKDPLKREEAYEKMKDSISANIKNAEEATKAEFERRDKQGWWATTKEDLKKLWKKFQNSWIYKKVSSWIPPETKERIKKDFMKAKNDIMSIWDDTTEQIKKEYKKYTKGEESAEKIPEGASNTTLVEDGEEDPELLKLMQQAKNEQQKAKPKKKSLVRSLFERFSRKSEPVTVSATTETEQKKDEDKPKKKGIFASLKGMVTRKPKKEEKKQETQEEAVDYDDDTAAAKAFANAQKVESETKTTSAKPQEEKKSEKKDAKQTQEEQEEQKKEEEKTSFFKSMKDSLLSMSNFFKKKEKTEKDDEEEYAKRVRGSGKAIEFKGSDDLSGFHNDFITFAQEALPLLQKTAFNTSFGFAKTISTIVKSGAGLAGDAIGGLATAYSGLARGLGSTLGGAARGIGSIAGGVLKSGLPSALISGLGSLLGGGARGIGSMVGGVGRGLGSAVGGAARGIGSLGGGMLNSLFGTGGVWTGFKNFGRRMMRPKYIDIYRKDKIEPGKPLLSAKQQEEGVFFADGKKVENSMDIKAPVFIKVEGDENPKTVISDEDLKAGLVDAQGRPLNESYQGGFLTIGGFGATVLKGIGAGLAGAASMYGKLLSALGLGAKTAAKIGTTMIGRLFGIDTDGTIKYQSEVIERLNQLIQILSGSHYVSYSKEQAAEDKKKADEEKAKADQAAKDAANDEKRMDANEQANANKKQREQVVAELTAGANVGGGGAGGPGGPGKPGSPGNNGPGNNGMTVGDAVAVSTGTTVTGYVASKAKGAVKSGAKSGAQALRMRKISKLRGASSSLMKQSNELLAQAQAAEKAGKTGEAAKLYDKAAKLKDKATKARAGAKATIAKAKATRAAQAAKADDAAKAAVKGGKGPKSKLAKRVLNILTRIWKSKGGRWGLIIGLVAAGAAAWYYFKKGKKDDQVENMKMRLLQTFHNRLENSPMSEEDKEQIRTAMDEMSECDELEGVQGYMEGISAAIESAEARAKNKKPEEQKSEEATDASTSTSTAAKAAMGTAATAAVANSLTGTVSSKEPAPRYKGATASERRFNTKMARALDNAKEKLAKAKTPKEKEFWEKQVTRLSALKENALQVTAQSATTAIEASAGSKERAAFVKGQLVPENPAPYKNQDELAKLRKEMKAEADKTAAAANTNEFMITTEHIGQTVNLDGHKVKLTAENIDKYVGKIALRSQLVGTLDSFNDTADKVVGAHIAKEMGSGVAKGAAKLGKVGWIKKTGDAIANSKVGNAVAKGAQWLSNTKVGQILAKVGGTTASKLGGVAGKALGFAGKISPHVMLAQAGYGAVRGLTMDDKERQEFIDERGKGTFGGGRFLDGSGFMKNMKNLGEVYKKKGFWSGTGRAFRMAANDAIGLFDFVEHGKTIGAFTREAGSTIKAGWDAMRSSSKANEPIKLKDGTTVTRTELLLRNKLKALDKPYVQKALGPDLCKLLREKITVAFTEQGAPDNDWGRRCANAAADLFLFENKQDDCLQRINEAISQLQKGDDAYKYVFGGAEDLLNQAKETAKQYYASSESKEDKAAEAKLATESKVDDEAAIALKAAGLKKNADGTVDMSAMTGETRVAPSVSANAVKPVVTPTTPKVEEKKVLTKPERRMVVSPRNMPYGLSETPFYNVELAKKKLAAARTPKDQKYWADRIQKLQASEGIYQKAKAEALAKHGGKLPSYYGVEIPITTTEPNPLASPAAPAKASPEVAVQAAAKQAEKLPVSPSATATSAQKPADTKAVAQQAPIAKPQAEQASGKSIGPAKFKITPAEIEAIDTPKRKDGKATDYAVRKAMQQKYGDTFRKLHPRTQEQYVRATYQQYLKDATSSASAPETSEKAAPASPAAPAIQSEGSNMQKPTIALDPKNMPYGLSDTAFFNIDLAKQKAQNARTPKEQKYWLSRVQQLEAADQRYNRARTKQAAAGKLQSFYGVEVPVMTTEPNPLQPIAKKEDENTGKINDIKDRIQTITDWKDKPSSDRRTYKLKSAGVDIPDDPDDVLDTLKEYNLKLKALTSGKSDTVVTAKPEAPKATTVKVEPKVTPSVVTNTDRITEKYSDVAKPVDVKESPIVKSYAETPAPTVTAKGDDQEWLKKFTSQNESGLAQQNSLLERLCQLMTMNIEATQGAGTGITKRINSSSQKVLGASIDYTNRLGSELKPPVGPRKPMPSAVNVNKASTVLA